MGTYYHVLGISTRSNDVEIRQAYKRKLLEAHPDKGGSVERYLQVKAAYDALSDPVARAQYDQVIGRSSYFSFPNPESIGMSSKPAGSSSRSGSVKGFKSSENLSGTNIFKSANFFASTGPTGADSDSSDSNCDPSEYVNGRSFNPLESSAFLASRAFAARRWVEVLVLGSSGCGKTAIVSAVVNSSGRSEPAQTRPPVKTRPTIGSDIAIMSIGNSKLAFFDLAGRWLWQELAALSILSTTPIVALVYSVIDRRSYQAVADFASSGNGFVSPFVRGVLILGTKSDVAKSCPEFREVSREDLIKLEHLVKSRLPSVAVRSLEVSHRSVNRLRKAFKWLHGSYVASIYRSGKNEMSDRNVN